MPSLKGLCWNVRGVTTVLHELTHLVEKQAPDFIVLTETKLEKLKIQKKAHRGSGGICRTHKLTPNMRERERTGAAGVAIAIHKKLAAHGSLKVTPLPQQPAATAKEFACNQQAVMLSTYGLCTCLMTWQ